jgi:Family of unknown function (DUF5990)
MPRAEQTEIQLRLVIEDPVPRVAHSLQDKESQPFGPQISKAGEALSFDLPIRIGPISPGKAAKFYGELVRSEGPERRFVYIAIGEQAGQAGSPWSRRMKINVHDIPQALLDKASKGKVIEGVIAGTGRDGTPACASVPLKRSWRAV